MRWRFSRPTGKSWNDGLLIGYADESGNYAFTGDPASETDQKAIAAVKEALGLQQYATADDVMARLIEEYQLEDYAPAWQRILGGIHYQMEQEAFSKRQQFHLAENVSDKTVATVKEHSLTLPGVGDCPDQCPQLHRRHHPAPCAGPGGEDYRGDVAGHR